MHTWGAGYLFGVGLSVLFWVCLIRPIDKAYYKRKAEILRKRKEKLAQKKAATTNN